MKKNYLKFLFGVLIVFSFFIFTGKVFCTTAKVNDTYYLEKPDSWKGSETYVNLINSNDNSKAFTEPGKKISKVLDKFNFFNIVELSGDLYMLPVTNDIASTGTYDKIIFSNGNNETTIENISQYIDISDNTVYNITDENGVWKISTLEFGIDNATKLQSFSRTIQTINPNVSNEIITSLDSISYNIQKILAGFSDVNVLEDVLRPLSISNKEFSKNSSLIDDLNKKIDEAKNIIKNGGYTEESTKKLEETIKESESIRDNIDYFTNKQVNDMINKLDQDINGLIPNTSELEKIIDEAKKIENDKYTDESSKILTDAIIKAEDSLNNKNSLTLDKINELIKNIKDAMSNLKEKNIVVEGNNPATGDILYIIIPVLVICVLTIAFTVIYSKKKNKSKANSIDE